MAIEMEDNLPIDLRGHKSHGRKQAPNPIITFKAEVQ